MKPDSQLRQAVLTLAIVMIVALVVTQPALAQDPFGTARGFLNETGQGGRTLVNSFAFLGLIGVAIVMIFGKGKIPGVWLGVIAGAVGLVGMGPMILTWISNRFGTGGLGGLGLPL